MTHKDLTPFTEAVALAIGCPDWDRVSRTCDGRNHPRQPHTCDCGAAARQVLELAVTTATEAKGEPL